PLPFYAHTSLDTRELRGVVSNRSTGHFPASVPLRRPNGIAHGLRLGRRFCAKMLLCRRRHTRPGLPASRAAFAGCGVCCGSFFTRLLERSLPFLRWAG